MTPFIAVVDDDIAIRESLDSLIRSAGMAVRVFPSAEDFLNSGPPKEPDCLILDVRMPGMRGIELHHYLMANHCEVPVVFITAHWSDEGAKSEASSDWTVAYLGKPFNDDELLDAVHAGLRLKSNHNHKS